MKLWFRGVLINILKRMRPPDPDVGAENRFLKEALNRLVSQQLEEQRVAEYSERLAELVEARQMAGIGPWTVSAETLNQTDRLIGAAVESIKSGKASLREAGTPIAAQGATGDIELALQNVEWRREINLSWLEFSRWGIQQIILISRLHYIKNPWIQRAINLTAQYVFGRGFEVMSDDPDANDVLKRFFERNKAVLGQMACAKHHRALGYDGQVFFVFFPDTVNKGEINVRTIDATEIFEIITDPDDTDKPRFYHRKWSPKVFDLKTGSSQMESEEAYYPALNWKPDAASKVDQINGKTVHWDQPILHHKGGTGVSKWHFDCPKAYAALDWAKAGRRWLEACATVRQALAQIALVLTTKGGQQALEGAKQQLQTSVGPTSNLWDQNPPANIGSTFASGPGTTLAAFNTKGAGGDPADVREYRSMVANVFSLPPTMLGDLETANLATATTLDRPTELARLEEQESWREVLANIGIFALKTSFGAPSGKLREAKRETKYEEYLFTEARRITLANGLRVYEKAKPQDGEIQVKVIFPAIREGDMPANVKAIAEAMTLDNKGGQVIGIDEKEGVKLLYEQLGVENAGDILAEQYPDKTYDPDRTKEPLPPPVQKLLPNPGGAPQNPDGQQPTPQQAPQPAKAQEAAVRFIESLKALAGKGKRKHGSASKS